MKKEGNINTYNEILLNLMDHCGHYLTRCVGQESHIRIRAMRFLLEKRKATQKDLINELLCSASTISELVKNMEGCGYITKKKNSWDRRKVVLEMTAEGKRCYEERGKRVLERQQKMFDVLNVEEKMQLLKILEKLNHEWEEEERRSGN